MTFEQAMVKLTHECELLEQASSDLQTAKALNDIGEPDKAVELFAQVRAKVRKAVSQ